VQVVDAGATRILAVETGLFADGKVEITGSGLRPGTRVAMPS
jgi:multidrug efflux system membrane fusion protein